MLHATNVRTKDFVVIEIENLRKCFLFIKGLKVTNNIIWKKCIQFGWFRSFATTGTQEFSRNSIIINEWLLYYYNYVISKCGIFLSLDIWCAFGPRLTYKGFWRIIKYFAIWFVFKVWFRIFFLWNYFSIYLLIFKLTLASETKKLNELISASFDIFYSRRGFYLPGSLKPDIHLLQFCIICGCCCSYITPNSLKIMQYHVWIC